MIWGFNPEYGNTPLSQAMQQLRSGNAFPGIVTDDTHAFRAASRNRMRVQTFNVILPGPEFQAFERRLIADRPRSQFSYGFPNGDGDCNCITWLERLALPLISGSMNEFVTMTASCSYPNRRFGQCT